MPDRFRDPWGWFLSSLPWPLRRCVIAWRFREWPWNVPSGARYIGLRRPSERDIERGRELARKYGW